MFKINAPVGGIDEVNALLKNGADEIYCGLITQENNMNHYNQYFSRRPFSHSNLKSFYEVKETVELAHKRNIPVYFTLNEPYLPSYIYPSIYRYIKAILSTGIDAMIVSDFNLILIIKKYFPELPIHLSTCASVFNIETIWFYEELGIRRIILPRHLSICEILELQQKSTIDLEILLLNDKCTFDDGLCYFLHFLEIGGKCLIDGGGCGLRYDVVNFASKNSTDKIKYLKLLENALPSFFQNPHREKACGACSLYNLKKLKMSIKIAGRQNQLERKIKDICFLRSVISLLLEFNHDFLHFKKRCKQLYKSIYGNECETGQCYYKK